MSNRKLVFGIFGLVVLFLVLGQISAFNFLFSGIEYVLGYASRPLYVMSEQVKDRFSSKQELAETNDQLKEQLQKIVVDYAELEKLRSENTVLRNELNFLQENEFTYVAAKVLSRTSIGDSSMYVLNQGTQSGVSAGMAVIYDEGVLLGKIIEAEEFTSIMLPITNQNSLISGLVLNEEQTPGLIRGEHNISLRMDFIPQDQQITEGQTVITSGEETYIPYGVVIGQIISITQSDSDFFQSATIASPLDYHNVQNVIILR